MEMSWKHAVCIYVYAWTFFFLLIFTSYHLSKYDGTCFHLLEASGISVFVLVSLCEDQWNKNILCVGISKRKDFEYHKFCGIHDNMEKAKRKTIIYMGLDSFLNNDIFFFLHVFLCLSLMIVI